MLCYVQRDILSHLSRLQMRNESIRKCKQKHSHNYVAAMAQVRDVSFGVINYPRLTSSLALRKQNKRTWILTQACSTERVLTGWQEDEISWDHRVKIKNYALNQIIQIVSESCLQEQQQHAQERATCFRASHLKHNFWIVHVARSQIFVFKKYI